MKRLFDIKTNIIPRLDPNCDSISESLNRLKIFKERNLEKICSCPNYFDIGNKNISDILIDIQKEASKLDGFEIPEIFSSALYPLNANILAIKKLISINNSTFILCKFPTHGIPHNYKEKLSYLINNNYLPIITNLDHSPLNNSKKLKEIMEMGCLFDIDLYNFFKSKDKKLINIIKYMEKQNSIITISGFNKLENVDESLKIFSRKTKIDIKKVEEVYCWGNPNLIINS